MFKYTHKISGSTKHNKWRKIMENAHINPIKYMNDFRYRHSMVNSLSERYRIPYKENSKELLTIGLELFIFISHMMDAK